MPTELAHSVQLADSPDPRDTLETQARLERLGFSTTLRSAAEIAVILQSAMRAEQ